MNKKSKLFTGLLLIGLGVGYYLKSLFTGFLSFINPFVGLILLIVGLVLFFQNQ